ncbi:MAG TPA: hypothetical protein PKC68_03900 [Alphaproteobacteria bacterium]|nr:hypothetical protein [Alphaproteobacteria bacterium]
MLSSSLKQQDLSKQCFLLIAVKDITFLLMVLIFLVILGSCQQQQFPLLQNYPTQPPVSQTDWNKINQQLQQQRQEFGRTRSNSN